MGVFYAKICFQTLVKSMSNYSHHRDGDGRHGSGRAGQVLNVSGIVHCVFNE